MRARVRTGVVTGERGERASEEHGSRERRRICERVNLRGQKKINVGIQILLTNREEKKKSSGKRKVGSVCARCESESEIGRYMEG
jgi:hypothetical protein